MHDAGPFVCGGPVLATAREQRQRAAQRPCAGSGSRTRRSQCFEGRLRNGGLLLSVQCEDAEWADRAQTSCEATGAEHVAAADGDPCADGLRAAS